MFRSGVIGVLSIVCACSAPPRTPSAPARAPLPGVTAAVAAPPLAPVPLPDSLFLAARLKHPARTLAALGFASVDDVFGKGLAGLGETMLPEAPVEMVITVERDGDKDPTPAFALSFGLSSLQAGYDYVRKRAASVEVDGVLYLRRDEENYCAVVPALGSAPARLVCGERPEALAPLLPYVARGMPLEPLDDVDLAMRWRIDAFRRVFGPELAELDSIPQLAVSAVEDNPSKRLLRETLSGLVTEGKALFADASTVSMAMELAGDTAPVVHVKTSFSFEGSTSWTTSFLRDCGRRAAPPPAAFWRLPADLRSAAYVSELNPVAYHGLRRMLGDVAQASLADQHASVPLQTRIRRIANETLTLPGGFVWGSGPLQDAPNDKLSAVAREARRDLGWHVIGMQRGSAAYRAYLEDVRGAANTPELLRLLDLEVRRLPAGDSAPAAPAPPHDFGEVLRGIRERGRAAIGQLGEPAAPVRGCWPPGQASCGQPSVAETVAVRRPRGAKLPTGSVTFEVRVPDSWLKSAPPGALAKAPPKRGAPLVVAVVLVPDDGPTGSRTWLGISADERLITEKLAAAVKGGGGTLETHPEFEPLKRPVVMSGLVRWDGADGRPQSLPYFVTANESGNATNLELTTELPLQTVVEEIVPLAAEL